jgi:hypothetical protein
MKKLETLEDILTMDTDTGKAQENKDLLKQIKQLLKKTAKKENDLEAKASEMPYEAVAVVGKNHVRLKFSLDTKEAVVVESIKYDQDVHNNAMATYYAINELKKLAMKK